MFKFLSLAALYLAGVSATSLSSSSPEAIKSLFTTFKQEFGRVYASAEEEASRFDIFVNHLKIIDERNAMEKYGAVHGITRFADLTQQEFESMYLDTRITRHMHSLNATMFEVPAYTGGLSAVDYTGKQTTAVKDQGSCGSCWAHACAEQIESDGMRLLGNPASKVLSVQQLVSCDHGKGQLGCGGGLQETGFDYVKANGGIVSAADYPYTAKTGVCDKTKTNYIMGVTSYQMILEKTPAATEQSFTDYMLGYGTISIGVDATTWNTYKSGIMTNCGKGTSVNHAVQLTGVDTASGYWKIRNSWGAGWGEAGSIRIQYGVNLCSLATEGGSHTVVYNI